MRLVADTGNESTGNVIDHVIDNVIDTSRQEEGYVSVYFVVIVRSCMLPYEPRFGELSYPPRNTFRSDATDTEGGCVVDAMERSELAVDSLLLPPGWASTQNRRNQR